MYDFTQLINDVGAAAITLGGAFGFLVKTGHLSFKKVGEVAVAVEHVAEDIVKTPAYKVIEADLHHKLNTQFEQYKQSEIARLALVALHGAESTYEALSDAEKASIVVFIKAELQKSNIQMSESDIAAAIQEAQKLADKFKLDERFVKAKEFTQILKSIAPKQDDTQTQQTPA